jgi:hypothetical protein
MKKNRMPILVKLQRQLYITISGWIFMLLYRTDLGIKMLLEKHELISKYHEHRVKVSVQQMCRDRQKYGCSIID